MKYLIKIKRSRTVFSIIAISVGLISKKAINYPAGSCVKVTQELTFNF